MIITYLDKNYSVSNNILDSNGMFLGWVLNNLEGIFGLEWNETLELFKGWIEPKLTSVNKTFEVLISQDGGPILIYEYRFYAVDDVTLNYYYYVRT